MKLAALFTVCGLAAVATAQNTMTYSWVVSDTGNGDGVIQPGESATLAMWASMSPGRTGFAGSIFDVLGGANWTTGTVTSYDNLLDALTNDGALQGNGNITNIESFQLPPFFNAQFKADNPIQLYSIVWTPSDYTARTVTVSDGNHLNNDVYTDTFGGSVAYTGVTGSATFEVVPTPATAALLGLGGLVATRRRR